MHVCDSRPDGGLILKGRLVTGLANVVLRGGALAARFALTVFLARYLSLEALGTFGLLYGSVTILPSLLGFGLNYRVSRELVGMNTGEAASLYRDRLIVTGVATGTAVVGYAALAVLHLLPSIPLMPLAVLIALLEAIFFDLHFGLLARRRSLLANVIVFVRSAAWVPPFIATAVFLPEARNLETLMWFWAAALVLTCFTVGFGLRGSLATLKQLKPFGLRVFGEVRNSLLVWGSDCAIVVASMSDRFIIGYTLGLEATGIYQFYWALANGSQVLINTGVVQPAMAGIIALAKKPGNLNVGLKLEVRNVLLWSILVFSLVALATYILVTFVGQEALAQNYFIVLILLCSSALRLCSDVLNYGLYALRADLQWAAVNGSAATLSLISVALGAHLAGLVGASCAVVTAECVLLTLRVVLVGRSIREREAGNTA